MKIYKSKFGKLTGSDAQVITKARRDYRLIQKLTPRRKAYIRSPYFNKDKVFVSVFWDHLGQKQATEQIIRLRYYRCAIDLLRNTTVEPDAIFSQSGLNYILYRFGGATSSGELFYVQVKHNKRTDRKDFISVFAAGKR